MRYSLSEPVQSYLFSVGFTGVVAWPMALMVEDVSPQTGQVIAGILLAVGIIHLALYFNTQRWARLVLSVTGIAWIFRSWLNWRVRDLQRMIKGCQDAIECFRQRKECFQWSRSDAEKLYREIRSRPHVAGLPTFDTICARAQTSMPDRITWSRMQYERGAHLAYEEGKFDAGQPNYAEYWDREVYKALNEALSVHTSALATVEELLKEDVAEAT